MAEQGRKSLENKIVVRVGKKLALSTLGSGETIAELSRLSTSDLIETVLGSALEASASDVHFEPEENETRIRFRIDGLLYDATRIPREAYQKASSRLKLAGSMKLNREGEAGDGNFAIRYEASSTSRTVDVRISVNPSEFGETIVLRLLDPRELRRSFGELGLRADDEKIADRVLKQPNGMVLVTGPTGSGKTTTLYAILLKLHTPEKKIITIEDPIEYDIAGIEQTEVNPDKGYTFESGLPSLLRQDPDVILVGEIRDIETAEIALDASLTGHLVLSTLHTNDALGAIPRLIGLGARREAIASALDLVVGERLVRTLCPNCREARSPTETERAGIESLMRRLPSRVPRESYAADLLYTPRGCALCNGMGYKGRIGVFELLAVRGELNDYIEKEASLDLLREKARELGFVSLQEDGVLKALKGVTTLDEVERATGPIVW
ncbi:MAG: type II/IV secretion system protein [Candidatus Colwellbacteria bacterium]|nr:type II/IV secretion system protein [Candidatus Colwellbacteria bacterium]